MSLTKEQISVLIADLVGGGDQPQNSKFHPSNIAKLVEVAYNTVIAIDYNQARNEGDHNINGDFYKTFEDVPVLFNKSRNEYYSEIPCNFISLRNDRGIGMISEMQNQANAFFPVSANSGAIWEGLEADSECLRPEFYVDGERVYYKRIPKSVEKVLMRIVSCIDNLEDDEKIPVPAQYEDELLNLVIAKLELEEQSIQDKYNDTNTK
jgi:hypothetical protein